MKVHLSFNPLTRQAQVFINGQIDEPFSETCSDQGALFEWAPERLRELIDERLPTKKVISLEFTGTQGDCDDLAEIVDRSLNERISLNCTVCDYDFAGIADALADLAQQMVECEQIPEFAADKNLQSVRAELDNTRYRIACVAPMSSGKSTLLNSMLGQKILPARNRPTTANIVEFENIDDLGDGYTYALNANDEVIVESRSDTVDYAIMDGWNRDPAISTIRMQTNFGWVSNPGFGRFVLMDTPGPNSSENPEHQQRLKDVIVVDNDLAAPDVVLFVLDQTKLGTNDEDATLNLVLKQIREGGKRAAERFVFVLNQIDKLNPEEDMSSAKDEVQRELSRLQDNYEIENVAIFPTSAKLGLLAQLSKTGRALSKRDSDELNYLKGILSEPELDLLEAAHCSERLREQIKREYDEADEQQELLLASGVVSIQRHIDQILRHRVMPRRLHLYWQLIDRRLAKVDRENRAKTDILENEAALEVMTPQIATLRTRLDRRATIERIKSKTDKLKVPFPRGGFVEIETDLMKTIRQYEPPKDTIYNAASGKKLLVVKDHAKNLVDQLVKKVDELWTNGQSALKKQVIALRQEAIATVVSELKVLWRDLMGEDVPRSFHDAAMAIEHSLIFDIEHMLTQSGETQTETRTEYRERSAWSRHDSVFGAVSSEATILLR